MALSRRRRDEGNIWAGFVDAVTTLLMVLMFVLTIFTVMQSVLRDQITAQTSELDQLNAQVAQLADALGLEKVKVGDLSAQVGTLQSTLSDAKSKSDQQSALIATLDAQLTAKQGELQTAQTKIASFEDQVAALLADKAKAEGQIGGLTASVADLKRAQTKLLTQKEALDLALAKARDEVDAQAEQARLAAARAQAIQAMLDEMKRQAVQGQASLAAALASLDAEKTTTANLGAQLATTQSNLSEAEKARLAEQAAALELQKRLAGVTDQLTDAEKQRLVDTAAAEALRAKLKSSDDALTAMTLALEDQRRTAEDTLKLLAAAEAAKSDAAKLGQTALDEKAALMAEAEKILSEKDQALVKSAERMALLNQQLSALRAQLAQLQGILNASAIKDSLANVQIENLGSALNQALAQVAAEQKRRADLEEAERKRLALENQDLSKYRSEFFSAVSKVMAGQQGVRVVGDRFVFSSEVLFQPGSADLSPEGQAQIASVVATLDQVIPQIPAEIPWIIRVDGHTDTTPLSGSGQFRDNWELSQARALSVVRYMQYSLGFAPQRLAATGFGEFQPVTQGTTPEDLAQDRRIELKLTER